MRRDRTDFVVCEDAPRHTRIGDFKAATAELKFQFFINVLVGAVRGHSFFAFLFRLVAFDKNSQLAALLSDIGNGQFAGV